MALEITKTEVEEVLESSTGNEKFLEKLQECVTINDIFKLLYQYVEFNEPFAAGVSTLAGQVGVQQKLFDNSYDVAQPIFAAAIDEFGDRTTGGKITHRRLAQALLEGIKAFAERQEVAIEEIRRVNNATRGAIRNVYQAYGIRAKIFKDDILSGIGFHIGSEAFADQEFNILQRFLEEKFASLVEFLKNYYIEINGVRVSAYRWIKIHTTVEADHAALSISAANRALREYTGELTEEQVKQKIIDGLRYFAGTQASFMSGISSEDDGDFALGSLPQD